MLTMIGSSRNISGLLIDGIDDPVATIEVVLVVSKPSYGLTEDGKIGRGNEIDTMRFHSGPDGLRALADRLLTYADEADDAFGANPSPDYDAVKAAQKQPEPTPASEIAAV